MLSRFSFLSGLILLSSCAYMQEGSIQDITLVTPGAENAICYLVVDGLRHPVRPPQNLSISKSREDLIVDCFAPGNRHKKVVIKADISNKAYGNVSNGVLPGLGWDYFSDAIFKYPDRIEIDFTNTPFLPEPMPAQNKPDIRQPEEYPLEEFLANTPRMNSDRGASSPAIRMREKTKPIMDSAPNQYMVQPEGVTGHDKGDLRSVIDGMKSEMNPAKAASQPAAKAAPETAGPAYPGQ
jgi:hypothetical protein